jgi:hypothetical protein
MGINNKPTVGGSDGTWGTELNSVLDSITPMTTVGDMIYASAVATGNGIPQRLPVGSNNQILTSNGSIPTWASNIVINGTLTASSGTTTLGTTNVGTFTATAASVGVNAITTTANAFTDLLGTVSSSVLASRMLDETGSGSLVFNTNPVFSSSISINNSSSNVLLNLNGNTSQLFFNDNNGTSKWLIYKLSSDGNFYFRDMLNGVMALTLAPGVGGGNHSMNGNMTMNPSSSTTTPLTIKGATSQTANLQQWQNSSGSVLVSISSNGNLTASTGLNALGHTTFTGGTATEPPMDFASGSLLSATNGGAIEYDGVAFYFTPEISGSGGRGVVPSYFFTSTSAVNTLTNNITAQNIFPTTNDTIFLAGNTTYEMEMSFQLFNSGSVAHSLQLNFGGNVGISSIGYTAIVGQVVGPSATFTASSISPSASTLWSTSSVSQVLAASTASAVYRSVFVKGLIRTNTTGSFIPQIILSASPTGLPVVQPNAYMKITPLGLNTLLATNGWS